MLFAVIAGVAAPPACCSSSWACRAVPRSTRCRRGCRSWARCRPRRSRSSSQARSSTARCGRWPAACRALARPTARARSVAPSATWRWRATRGNLRTVDFLGLKVLLAGIFAGVAVLLLGVVFGNFVFGFVAGIGFALLGFVLPDFWLGRHISDRKKRILRAVPDTLDLLTISVRAGLGFDGALAKVVEKTEGPLAEEFRRVLAEVRMGKARRDALRDVVARTKCRPDQLHRRHHPGRTARRRRSARCSRSSPSSCASSAASTPKSWPPRRRSRCSSRW